MKVGLVLGYSGAGFGSVGDKVQAAERLGFDSIWTSEAEVLVGQTRIQGEAP